MYVQCDRGRHIGNNLAHAFYRSRAWAILRVNKVLGLGIQKERDREWKSVWINLGKKDTNTIETCVPSFALSPRVC